MRTRFHFIFSSIFFLISVPRIVPTPPCQEKKLIEFLEPLGVNSPEAILTLASSKTISKTCRSVANILLALETYISACSLTRTLDYYAQLTAGINCMFDYICTDTDFQSR